MPPDFGGVREDVAFSVTARVQQTPVIIELILQPLADHIKYASGQYVLVGDMDNTRPVRSYSIANAPRPDGTVTLLVTRVPHGELSTWLHQLRPGDQVLLSGPYGSFVDDLSKPGPRLYLAGGSGLAPIRALLEAALGQTVPPSMTLLFSARHDADLIDDVRLQTWADEHEQFRYLRTLTRATGPPPIGHVPDVLRDLLPPLDRHLVYIAGSSGFVAACDIAVRRHRAAAGRVFTEEFFTEPRPWGSGQ